MPDMDRVAQIQMLTNLMSTMPPQVDKDGNPKGNRVGFPKPKAAQWATELVTKYGVRVHPELATDKTLPGGSAQRIDDVAMNAADLLALLRDNPLVPSLALLADQLEAALGDPLKERAMIDSIKRQYPDLMKTARLLQARLEEEQQR